MSEQWNRVRAYIVLNAPDDVLAAFDEIQKEHNDLKNAVEVDRVSAYRNGYLDAMAKHNVPIVPTSIRAMMDGED